MLAVRTIYWSAAGKYRTKKGKVTHELPLHLLNGGDRQAHSLSESPVYVLAEDPLFMKKPMQTIRWDDLIGNEAEGIIPLPVPPPPIRSEGLAVLVEEGAIWPITPVPFTDDLARQKEQANTHAEALALARAREARAGSDNALQKAAFILLMVLVGVMVLVIAIVALNARFGGEDLPPSAHHMAVQEQTVWS